MALAPPPFMTEEFDIQWRTWLNGLSLEVNPPPATSGPSNGSVPVIVVGPEYSAGSWPLILLCDTDLYQDMTINMPAAAGATSAYHIKKLGTGGNVTVDGNASETIDGGVIASIEVENESIMIVSDNTKWYVI